MGDLSELTVAILRFGFLAVLWLFVLIALSVMRRDLFRSGSSAPAPSPLRRQSVPAGPPAGHASGGPAVSGGTAERDEDAPARPDGARPRTLVVTGGDAAGTTIPLDDRPVTIGRSTDCTLALNDQYASTRHARVYPRDGQWYVEDLSSTNGTYLGRAKLTSPALVPVGVPIRIGKTVVELQK